MTVWFSEKDVGLRQAVAPCDRQGARQLSGRNRPGDAGLLKSLRAEGIADKELSVLLATDRVIPVAHDTTFEALRDVSPMLASRSGLSTAESSLVDVAAKIADTVLVDAVLV